MVGLGPQANAIALRDSELSIARLRHKRKFTQYCLGTDTNTPNINVDMIVFHIYGEKNIRVVDHQVQRELYRRIVIDPENLFVSSFISVMCMKPLSQQFLSSK